MKQKCKLFDSLVSSILNYSSEIWGYHKAPDIEVLHCKFLRRLLCVNKSTNTTGLYGELGRLSLTEIRRISICSDTGSNFGKSFVINLQICSYVELLKRGY